VVLLRFWGAPALTHVQAQRAAVRRDNLANVDEATEYEMQASPTRSAIFEAGETSRVNVANFRADRMTDDSTWNRWKGQRPVLYNKSSP